jgi:cytochrome c2
MPDRNDLPGSWLATLAALTAVGIGTSHAQPPLRAAVTPTGADLFKQQCATCHSLNATDPPRQGPVLAGVYGRKPGSLAGFHYSPGHAKVDFVWDEETPRYLFGGSPGAHSRRHHALQTEERSCSQSHHLFSEGAEMKQSVRL